MKRSIIAALVLAGCNRTGEVVHAAEVFCHERANEWTWMASDYHARAAIASPTPLAGQAADATYGILAPDARRVWASAASSSFAFCLEIRALDAAQAQELERAFAAAHASFLAGGQDVVAQAHQVAEMANALRAVNQRPARD